MLPLFPIVAALFSATGLGGLVWYYSLSDDDKKEADRLTAELAEEVYHKTVEELDRKQKEDIHNRVKVYFR